MHPERASLMESKERAGSPTETKASPSSPPPPAPTTPSSARRSSAKTMNQEKVPGFLREPEIVYIEMYDDGHRVDNIPVHKRFLTHYSHFFKRAFAPGTEETRRRAMRITVMRYVRPDVFQVYLGWVYSQQITMTPETTQTQQALVDLWRLAEKFATPRLQNQAADLLYAIMFRDGVDVALDLNHIYDSAHNQSPLRRVLVFAFASPALRWDMFTDAMLPKHLLFKLVKTYKQAHDARRDMAKPLNDEERMRQFHVIEEL